MLLPVAKIDLKLYALLKLLYLSFNFYYTLLLLFNYSYLVILSVFSSSIYILLLLLLSNEGIILSY